MIYSYECKFCKIPTDMVKPVTRYEMPERCPKCRVNMKRLFVFNSRFHKSSFTPGWEPAFGKHFSTRHDQKEEIRRIYGETGKQIIEIGNDSSTQKRETPQVDIAAATRELRGKWQQR